jgi:hypothetical protein
MVDQKLTNLKLNKAEDLARTHVGDFIQNKVDDFLKIHEVTNKVHVRMVHAKDTELLLKPNLINQYNPEKQAYSYR